MIYLDNNATTKVLPEVRDAMIKYLTDEYGNPSSKYYQLAINAKKGIDDARRIVSRLFSCDANEVIFISGSTESNNMIFNGLADLSNKKHIIISNIEHQSIMETAKFLESHG